MVPAVWIAWFRATSTEPIRELATLLAQRLAVVDEGGVVQVAGAGHEAAGRDDGVRAARIGVGHAEGQAARQDNVPGGGRDPGRSAESARWTVWPDAVHLREPMAPSGPGGGSGITDGAPASSGTSPACGVSVTLAGMRLRNIVVTVRSARLSPAT